MKSEQIYSIKTKISLNRKDYNNNYSLTIYRINPLITTLDNILLLKTFNNSDVNDQLSEKILGDFLEMDEIRLYIL